MKGVEELKLTSGEYKIIKLGTFRCNCYVIQFRKVNILVDTSVKLERKLLLHGLAKNSIHTLDGIFITHNHWDHIQCANWLSKRFGCKVYLSPLSVYNVGLGYSTLPKGTGFISKIEYVLATKLMKVYNFCLYEPCRKVARLTPQLLEQFLGKGVTMLETPGHTEDSISFLVNGRVALVGDAMVNEFGRIYPPFAECENKIKESWKVLVSSGARVFLPGHGKPVGIRALRKGIRDGR